MHAEIELSGSPPPEHFQTICVEYLGAANHIGIDHGPSFSYEKSPPCGGRFSELTRRCVSTARGALRFAP